MDMQNGTLSKLEPALVPPITNDAWELLHLRGEVERLEADSKAEQNVIDNLLQTLTTTQDDLASAKACLADKESECASLRDKLDQQQPATLPTAAAGRSSVVVGLHQKIEDLAKSLAEKDALARAAWAEVVQERKDRVVVAQELRGTIQERDQLVAEKQSTASVQQQQQQLEEKDDDQNRSQDKDQVRELQELVQYFKSNSEVLAKEIRGLQVQNRQLGEDMDVRNKCLEDELSANIALKMQAGIA
ncbi:hypothetical protein F503_02219 [Ophiostoma piceae UAMH 11346]|uniref:Uncharacterized protein n=1 Tax=Ophiostoma piceae (strain UAMH 11346) TaxID=1262450 RepID=S3CXA5_OPHP1|nr:hypothetical protein F503_02219 [Ophiostoma piceae UAMH 11346]